MKDHTKGRGSTQRESELKLTCPTCQRLIAGTSQVNAPTLKFSNCHPQIGD